MCISPVKVPNNRKDFNGHVDRSYNIVPCNHCRECQTMKKHGLVIRSISEYHLCKKLGGTPYFCTLTYNEDKLPYASLDGCLYPAFCSDDVQKWLKRLRYWLYKQYGASVRYLVTSEYGARTHRPHYHCLLFFSCVLSHYQIKKLLQKSWLQGFTYGSHRNHGIINSNSGIKYVCKYCTKDLVWESEHKDFLQEIKSDMKGFDNVISVLSGLKSPDREELVYHGGLCKLLANYKSKFKLFQQYYEILKMKPFVLKSINYGMSIFDDELIQYDGRYFHYYDEDSNSLQKIKVPSYYGQKLARHYYENMSITKDMGSKISYKSLKRDYRLVISPVKETSSSLNPVWLSKQVDLQKYAFDDMVKSIKDKISFIKDMDDHFFSVEFGFTNNDYQFLCSIDDNFINDYAYYQMYNRAYSDFILLPLEDSFIDRHTITYLHEYSDKSDEFIPIIAKYARLYNILYKYVRVNGDLLSDYYTKLYLDKKMHDDYLRWYNIPLKPSN